MQLCTFKRGQSMPAKKMVLGLSTLALLSSCSSFGTKENVNIEIDVKKYVLDNGLTVLIAPNPRLPIASYYTLFDIGGKDEGKGTTGATHFLEHMMFKGAKKYGPGEFDTLIEKNGGSTNAFTSNDMTVYYQNIPSSFVPKMIDMEADRMQNLLLVPASFESERQVIFEERKMRYENSPDGLLFLAMMKKVFEGTPYGQSVIGDVADLKALTRDQMMKFFKDYYVPNNAIVAITGDVNPEETIEVVKKHFGPIPFSTKLKELKAKANSAESFVSKAQFGKSYKYYATNPNPKFVLAYQADKAGDARSYTMDILSMILGNGGSSYLNQKYVRSENPILTDVYLANFNLMSSGVFYFGGELRPGIPAEKIKEELEKDFKEMCGSAITSKNLQKAKNQVMAQAYNKLKSNSGIALTLVRNEKYYGDYAYGFKEMDKYNAVTKSDVVKACRETLLNSPAIFISVSDKYAKTEETH